LEGETRPRFFYSFLSPPPPGLRFSAPSDMRFHFCRDLIYFPFPLLFSFSIRHCRTFFTSAMPAWAVSCSCPPLQLFSHPLFPPSKAATSFASALLVATSPLLYLLYSTPPRPPPHHSPPPTPSPCHLTPHSSPHLLLLCTSSPPSSYPLPPKLPLSPPLLPSLIRTVPLLLFFLRTEYRVKGL